MSDGYVTVAQCVEGLPLGVFVWEMLVCAFMAWLLLGAVNETTPLAFSFISTEWAEAERVSLTMSSALAAGNFTAILVGGLVADKYGRLAVIRPALLSTIVCGMLVQITRGYYASVATRLALGLVSGAVLGVLPPLVAELLPARHRGFYLTVWCAGWPAGALYSILSGCLLPTTAWRTFYSLMLIPAVVLYVCTRADMMLESPRYLYLMERRDEGYEVLLDMYEKEQHVMPWAPETIAVTCAAPGGPLQGSEPNCCGRVKRKSSKAVVLAALAVMFFTISAAGQSFRLWMPLMIVADAADEGTLVDHPRPGLLGLALMQAPEGGLSFAQGPIAAAMLSTARAPLMLHDPNYMIIVLLSQAYFIQLVGVVAFAYMSSWAHRRQVIQWSTLAAATFGLLTIVVAERGSVRWCGPILGLQLAAQAGALNFLQAFACEYFPTVSRAQAVAVANFSAQLGNFVVPMLGSLLVKRVSPAGALVFFSLLYVVGWAASLLVPLPSTRAGSEQPLTDVDRKSKSGGHGTKSEWPDYHSI